MLKKISLYTYFALVSVLIPVSMKAQIVKIPDANFKQTLINLEIDTNGDGEIQVAEAKKVTRLYIDKADISSLTGIKSFTNLTEFGFYDNHIKTLDLEGMTSLVKIYGFNSQIEGVNIKGLKNLETLYLQQNKIRIINLTELKKLKELKIDGNMLTKIDISNLPNLEEVEVQSNKITEFKADKCPAIKSINLSGTWLSNLDFTPFKNIEEINVNDNEFLAKINIIGLRSLKSLTCVNTPITNINMNGTVNLKDFGW
ncbi:leucine-rich repeat domain-containing protein [Flavobacterium sp. '19STA2R22 D10 B1']|uniref:leucine-rich repeat domain-containing protein n=1 Tax=Flavobacterium aerium TaxID=3037261 RepID=UPI00278BEDC7|nr:hypothetical protein [Flavobacterium sp. '19STA2R22 D10 B1']